MTRTLYLTGISYVAVSAFVLAAHWRGTGAIAPHADSPPAGLGGPWEPAGQWFVAIKPYCNAVEVELAQRQRPAPATPDGQGYSAACYALGGKIELARAAIERLPAGDRAAAAAIVFGVGHPVADAGDDRSAGPIMELVVEYIPNHYMALYHAGMSEYALGQTGLARTHLESFLSYYTADDGWTRNARDVLARLR